MNSSLKIGVGSVLALAAAVLIVYVSMSGEAIIPGVIGSAATLVMALGVLLIGTSENDGRAV